MKISIGVQIIITLFGGFLARWHGAKIGPEVPRSIKNFCCAFPFGIAAVGITGNPITSVICFLMSLTGVSTGHGRGISLLDPVLRGSPEYFEFLTLWLIPKMSTYNYKCVVLAVNGFIITSGATTAFTIHGNYLCAALAALGGLLKPLAYVIGWKIYPEGSGKGIPHLNEATAIGEFLSGVFQLGFLSLAMALS